MSSSQLTRVFSSSFSPCHFNTNSQKLVKRKFRENHYHCLPRFVSTGSDFPKQREYDAVIVGGGHNGLVAAAYLAKSGLK